MEKKNNDEIGQAYFDERLDDIKKGEFENDDDLYNLINDFCTADEKGYVSNNTEEDDDQCSKETCFDNRYSKNELISRNKFRSMFKGYDNETGAEIAWTEYYCEDLTLSERASLFKVFEGMKYLNHPNVLKYYYVCQNNQIDVMIVIHELECALKHYLK